MTELDLTALRATAEAATPGPWDAEIGESIEVNAGTARTEWNDGIGIAPSSWTTTDRILEHSDAEFELVEEEYEQRSADAEHIAAFDPVTAIALLDRLTAAESALESVRLYCENQGDKFRHHAGRILEMIPGTPHREGGAA